MTTVLLTLLFSLRIKATTEFCTGIVSSRNVSAKTLNELKRKISDHMTGISTEGRHHLTAVTARNEELNKLKPDADVYKTQLDACSTVTRLNCAAGGYEKFVSILSSKAVDVGTISHSRYEIASEELFC